MRRIVLNCRRGGTLRIRAEAPEGALYRALWESPPTVVELMHVKWAGEAIFFVHDAKVPPTPGELTSEIEEGSLTYYAGLREFILCYGPATPQGKEGRITVGRVGHVDDLEALRTIGDRIWRSGAETAEVSVV